MGRAKGVTRVQGEGDHAGTSFRRSSSARIVHGLSVTATPRFRQMGRRVNPRDAILMGIDRIEHFMGGDAILSTRPAYSSLETLDVTRPEVDSIMKLYLDRNVYYDATVTAYGYWYDPKDMRVFKTWMDEQSFLTPHAREVANARLPRRPNEQFKRIYEVKLKEVKRFYDAGGGRFNHGRHGDMNDTNDTNDRRTQLVDATRWRDHATHASTDIGRGTRNHLGRMEAGQVGDGLGAPIGAAGRGLSPPECAAAAASPRRCGADRRGCCRVASG